MREDFEKLPEIAARIEKSEAFYCPKGDWYLSPHDDCREDEAFLDGAYYAFQEQQKKIDKLSCNHLWTGKSENQYCSKCGEVD